MSNEIWQTDGTFSALYFWIWSHMEFFQGGRQIQDGCRRSLFCVYSVSEELYAFTNFFERPHLKLNIPWHAETYSVPVFLFFIENRNCSVEILPWNFHYWFFSHMTCLETHISTTYMSCYYSYFWERLYLNKLVVRDFKQLNLLWE